VPGIDFTNDPLLQGRLFSYTDTQLSRLGSPNFHEIPINRSIAPTFNNQRDGHMRQTINKGQSSYDPNTTGGGCPFQAKSIDGGFISFQERVDSKKVRARSASFFDHFSQATLFYNSQSEYEKRHLTKALCFELGKVENADIKERMLVLLAQVDKNLAATVADSLGMLVPKAQQQMNHSVPADGDPKKFQPTKTKSSLETSPTLSMVNTIKSIKTLQVAILVSTGTSVNVNKMKLALETAGAQTKVIAPKLGFIELDNGIKLKVDQSFLTSSSVLFDAVYIPGGSKSISSLKKDPDVLNFVKEAFVHCKPIIGEGEGEELFKIATGLGSEKTEGVLFNSNSAKIIGTISQHRFFNREIK
jgi:catalase